MNKLFVENILDKPKKGDSPGPGKYEPAKTFGKDGFNYSMRKLSNAERCKVLMLNFMCSEVS